MLLRTATQLIAMVGICNLILGCSKSLNPPAIVTLRYGETSAEGMQGIEQVDITISASGNFVSKDLKARMFATLQQRLQSKGIKVVQTPSHFCDGSGDVAPIHCATAFVVVTGLLAAPEGPLVYHVQLNLVRPLPPPRPSAAYAMAYVFFGNPFTGIKGNPAEGEGAILERFQDQLDSLVEAVALR